MILSWTVQCCINMMVARTLITIVHIVTSLCPTALFPSVVVIQIINYIGHSHVAIYVHTYYCMWLLWKLIQIAQQLKSILLLNIKALLLPRNTKHMAIDDHVCFHRWPFAIPIKPLRCTAGSLGPVNGINEDVSGARLLPTTVSTYPVDWVCFCHLLKTQHCCLCPSGSFNLPSAAHPPPPPTPPAQPL